MITPTLTCEHCESEIDVAKDPHCIQNGGMDVICAACRQREYEKWLIDLGGFGTAVSQDGKHVPLSKAFKSK